MNDYVLITGASSGIGRQIAVTLAAEYPLILSGRDEDCLQESAELCRREDTILWPYDLREVAGIGDSLRGVLQEKALAVQAFVHSAGISPIAPLRMLRTETMQQIMNVNFFSAAEITKVLVKKKVNKQHLSRIVFISSLNSNFGAKGHSIYCASKGAMNAFMRAMADELAPRVRVNSILPGRIFTDMTNNDLSVEEFSQTPLMSGYLLGDGDKQDIADMTYFLLSERSKWITGQEFIVDGGKSAH